MIVRSMLGRRRTITQGVKRSLYVIKKALGRTNPDETLTEQINLYEGTITPGITGICLLFGL